MDKQDSPAGESLPAAHIVECVSRSISTDRTTAMAVFKIADGSKFAITLPVGGLKQLQSMVNDMVAAAAKLELNPGMVAVKRPKGFAVGNSPNMRGCVAVTFDPETEAEAVYVMRDADALTLVKAIGADVMGRMTQSERLKTFGAQSALLRPGVPKLVLPGQ